jgi:hypothetical protein
MIFLRPEKYDESPLGGTTFFIINPSLVSGKDNPRSEKKENLLDASGMMSYIQPQT